MESEDVAETVKGREPGRKNIVVTGYARHGKDTFCEMLLPYLNYESSSMFCAEEVVLPALREKGIVYRSAQECFDDRHNHRAEWFTAIRDYNRPDAAKLGKKIFESYDVYCGLRNREELEELREQKVVDLVIWIDASFRIGSKEGKESITILPSDADIVLLNNGSLEELRTKADRLVTFIRAWNNEVILSND